MNNAKIDIGHRSIIPSTTVVGDDGRRIGVIERCRNGRWYPSPRVDVEGVVASYPEAEGAIAEALQAGMLRPIP